MWSHLKDKKIILPKITDQEISKKVEPVLRQMEKTGIRINIDEFKKLEKKLTSDCQKLQKKIIKLAGEDFNIASPSQLSEILFDKLKLSKAEIKKTKSGLSTAASELRKLEGKHEIIKPILQFREYSKLLSTYIKPLPLIVDDESRLHTTYGQDTTTGRITSSEPNLQNIPIKGALGPSIRKAFVADSGFKLISADYSQIELRVVACLAEDEKMISAFKNREDIHSHTASELFKIDQKKVTHDQRRLAKTVNFGVLYGMSSYGLSETLGISRESAGEYIRRYFDIHVGIKKYCDRMIDEAKEKGYVETLFGYRRYLPNINSVNQSLAESEERMAINTPVQGSAAELLKLAMIKLTKEFSEKNSDCKLLLTVHDELVIEAPEKKSSEIATLVKKTMEEVITLCVPIEVEVGTGKNWGEAK